MLLRRRGPDEIDDFDRRTFAAWDRASMAPDELADVECRELAR